MTVLTPENRAYARRLVDQAPEAGPTLRAILAPLLAETSIPPSE